VKINNFFIDHPSTPWQLRTLVSAAARADFCGD